MKKRSRIYVAGGTTLAGKAIQDYLLDRGYTQLIESNIHELNLNDSTEVNYFFSETEPEYVFLTAGMSGGIEWNQKRPVDLVVDNLTTGMNILQAAYSVGVKKLLYLGSSCSYPRLAPQPMPVESLMTGPLEPTSAPYAMAKLTLLRLCQAYRSQYGANYITAIPANCFGPHDDFNPASGHVIPSLMRRCHEAKLLDFPELEIWGTGTPRREFLYSKDLADGCLFLMNRHEDGGTINLGGSPEISILETATAVVNVVGYQGKIVWNPNKPDGMHRKRLDCTPLANLGWKPRIDFVSALTETYEWFLNHGITELDGPDMPTNVLINHRS